jgi:hypothetical protein
LLFEKSRRKPSISNSSNTLAVQPPKRKATLVSTPRQPAGFFARQNDSIKGYEREMPDHKPICGGLLRQDLNSLS